MVKILKESLYIVALSLILGFISYIMIDDYSLFENNNANNIFSDEYSNLEPGVHLINIDYAKSLYDSNLEFLLMQEKSVILMKAILKNLYLFHLVMN